jgi:HSP20 family protein
MADLVPRREGSEVMTLRDAVDRLFQESVVRPWSYLFPSAGGGRSGMSLDVYEEGNNIMVEASLPGVKPEEVDIRIQGDVLTIKAETKQEKDLSEDKYTYKERSYGMVQRNVPLPVAVNADKAEAKLENGVLKLTLPKTEEAAARQIKIKK